jgi:hypothetical protein
VIAQEGQRSLQHPAALLPFPRDLPRLQLLLHDLRALNQRRTVLFWRRPTHGKIDTTACAVLAVCVAESTKQVEQKTPR